MRAARMIPVINGPNSRQNAIVINPGTSRFRAEAVRSSVTGKQRHGQAEEERDHADQRHRPEPGPLGLLEENVTAKRQPAAGEVILDSEIMSIKSQMRLPTV